MHQIKIFKGLENDLAELEEQVNSWLAESDARILGVFGNIAPQSIPAGVTARGLTGGDFASSDVLLVIHYHKA
jgi:hypothetical protein